MAGSVGTVQILDRSPLHREHAHRQLLEANRSSVSLQRDVAAAQVVHLLDPRGLEHPQRHVALLPVVADEQDRLVTRKAIDAVAQQILAQVGAAAQVRLCEGNRVAKVDGNGLVVQHEVLHVRGEDRGAEAGAVVLRGERRHVHRAVRAVERRRVRKVDLGKVRDGELARDCGGHHVQPFVHAHPAGGLGAQEPARCALEHHHEAHLLGAGVVGGVAGLVDHHRVRVDPGPAGCLQAQARGPGDRAEQLDHGRAHGAAVGPAPAERVLRGDPALPVGGAGERHADRAPGHRVLDLHHVAGGEDARVVRAQARVHDQAARLTDREARLLRQSEGGADAHGEQHEVGIHRRAITQGDLPVRD